MRVLSISIPTTSPRMTVSRGSILPKIWSCSASAVWTRAARSLTSARGYTRDEFAEHIRTEHSTFRWLFEPMLTAVGFEIVEADSRRRVYATYTYVKR
jgi:hypothetical protein